MRTLIIEDKAYIRKGLLSLLATLETDIEVIGECASVKEAVVVANACRPQLVFLDINLTDGTGFDFLDQTGHLDFKVIFITAYEEFALKALKVGAVDYLLKPVDANELKDALEKVRGTSVEKQKQQLKTAQRVFDKDDTILILSLQDAFQLIDLKQLVFCESDKGYTTFYLANGKKYLASKSLKEFETQLLNNDFARPHQSFMVNLRYIDKYEKSGVIHLQDGTQIPVSSRKKDHFVSTFLKRKRH